MENKIGVFIIESIQHCPSGMIICQNMQNQEMWIHCFIERNWINMSSIVLHTVLVARECVRRNVWNTINDRNSSFALLSNIATFPSVALLSNLATFLGYWAFYHR